MLAILKEVVEQTHPAGLEQQPIGGRKAPVRHRQMDMIPMRSQRFGCLGYTQRQLPVAITADLVVIGQTEFIPPGELRAQAEAVGMGRVVEEARPTEIG